VKKGEGATSGALFTKDNRHKMFQSVVHGTSPMTDSKLMIPVQHSTVADLDYKIIKMAASRKAK
jgi:hypothetical protein